MGAVRVGSVMSASAPATSARPVTRLLALKNVLRARGVTSSWAPIAPRNHTQRGREVDPGLFSDGLDAARVVVAHRHRDRLQIPDDAHPGHDLEQIERDVDLPPVKALARRARVVVVIVVPAFTERDQREEPVVAARIARPVTLLPIDM